MKKYNFLKTRKIKFKPKNLFTISLRAAFLISEPVAIVSANPVTVTVNGSSYSIGAAKFSNYNDDLSVLQSQSWWGDSSLATSFADAVKATLPFSDNTNCCGSIFTIANPSATNLNFIFTVNSAVNTSYASIFTLNPWTSSSLSFGYYYAYLAQSDDGDATYSITGQTYAGKTLTAGVSSNDPDGNGSVTSYTWQSSSDGSNWSNINGATSSTFTVTSSEEGKYIRVTVAYTDGEGTSESVTASSITISQLHTEWIQPYAAMQNIGLGSIKSNRDLVLAKAGQCNNYGWVIGDTDYCVYTNANNTTASVNGNSSYGGYDYAKFNTSLNVEKTINDRWKAGVAYGVGSSNLDNYNFSSTTASLSSTNTHYSIYGVKKVSDKFTLKGMIGGSDFDYKGNRNYSTTSATSAYDTDGYTAEINGIWDIKKNIKNMKTPIRLQPTVGVAYAAHTQDGFSESGSGDLVTIDPNQAESILFKTGISIDKQIPMEGGKWILVPSLALNYEMDPYSDDDHRSIKGGLTESSTAHTKVSSKTLGQHNGSVKVGADFICTKDFMFNLNAEYGLAEGGDEQSYGGGFRWQF